MELPGEVAGQSTLAYSNRTFYGNIAGWFKEIGHVEVAGDSAVQSSKEE